MAKMPALMTLLAFVAIACASPDEVTPTDPLVPEVIEADEADLTPQILLEPARLSVDTYDGSGEMVHPDALVFPHKWQGHRYWFAATPYPLGNSNFENPSAFAGDSATDWHELPGAVNPLARPVTNAYLSDPDLAYDREHDRIRLYYRQTTLEADQIFVRTSATGSDWSPPTLVIQDKRYALISPAVVREANGSWRLWAVNATDGGCRAHANALTLTQRRSPDGMSWGAPEPVALTIPGYVPWHWDVQYISARREYWALIAAYPDAGNCSLTSIYFARSADGTQWNVSPFPLLERGSMPQLRDLVYRSTFRYFANSDAVRVWFSGARLEEGSFHYSLAVARYPFAELLRRVSAPRAPGETLALHQDDPRRASLHAAREAFTRAFP
ncbi:MAG: hypothetical protein M3Z05_05490 [Gemmatimonadota bacterium]|nr:hypothetical protein [Gemmatimonadota bacterium]